MASDTLRVPPILGSGMPRPGSLVVSSHYSTKAVLDTYSPYPIFKDAPAARDPFGLNAFLLAPFDDVWQYMNPAVQPTEELHLDDRPQIPSSPSEPQESRRLSNLRRRSPLASQPPVSAEAGAKADDVTPSEDDVASLQVPDVADVADVAGVSTSTSNRKSLPSGTRLRALMGRKMTDPTHLDGTDESSVSRLSESRTDSVCSALSSVSSSSDGSWEGIETPVDGAALSTDVSPAMIAAALDEGGKKAGWRDWINNRRSLLGLKAENGAPLLESPRSSVLDLAAPIPEPESVHSRVANTDAARTAAQLRRLSIAKLASLRMPSPHPLALVLARQHVNLPDEVAFSIPSSKRVYPMSVNIVQRTGSDLAPAQGGGLRLALAVRGIITKIDQGERPYGASLHGRRTPRQNNIARPRGVRDFISRPPFEERMVTYYPDDLCTHVSMARSGFAIYDLEFSDYILAVAKTEDSPPSWNASPKPRVASTGSLPPPPRRSSPTAVDKRASRLLETQRQSLFEPKEKPEPRAERKSTSSFRTARPKPATWEDSSDEEELDTDREDNRKPPVRPVPVHTRTNVKSFARARESRLVDAATAMEMLNRARERRAEFNAGECARKAESATRNSVMLLGKPALQSTPAVDTQTRKLQHRASAMSLGANSTRSCKQRPPSSLPASPRAGPQPDRRRVVSQYDPMAMVQQHSNAMGMGGMGMGMYGHGLHGVPPVPGVPMYPSPMMAQPMMYAPVAIGPGAPVMGFNHHGFNHQFNHMPSMPHMYRPPPQMQIAAPGMLPSRRRDRPVS